MREVRLFEAKYQDPICGPVRVELIQSTGRDNLNYARFATGEAIFRRDSEDFDEFRNRAYRTWKKVQESYLCVFSSRRGNRHET